MSVGFKKGWGRTARGAVEDSCDVVSLTSTRSSTLESPLLWDRIRAEGLWVAGGCMATGWGRGWEPRPTGGWWLVDDTVPCVDDCLDGCGGSSATQHW